MLHLIKHGQPRHDDWNLVDDGELVPDGEPVILPLSVYRAQKAQWDDTARGVGVWLNDEQMAEDVIDSLDNLSLVALRFPKFADGRGFSKARLLRDRYGYKGEIRAIGDFLPDQVFYMSRCGIDAFACRNEDEAATTLSLLNPFSVRYQSDTHNTALFTQR